MIRRKGLLALLLPFALLLGGCCHPPVKEISLAKAQLMEAREAGAPIYAPEKYKEAENLLSQAEAESKKECQKSWKTVKLAQQKAKEAKEAAIKAKLQARVEALKAIRRAQKALTEAREAEAPLYAPDLYQAATNLLEEAQKDFQRESYLESKKKSDKAAQLALKAKEAVSRKTDKPDILDKTSPPNLQTSAGCNRGRGLCVSFIGRGFLCSGPGWGENNSYRRRPWFTLFPRRRFMVALALL